MLWDGEQVYWSHGDADTWLALSGTPTGAVQFPGFVDEFDAAAPPHMRGYSPPFLTALPEAGGVQIWTGLLARTRPGWSLNVRMPVNLPGIPGLTSWEGIVETDHWFGPLFNNFRLTRTDFPVRLHAQAPFLQVQPVPQIAYSDDALNNVPVRSMDEMRPEDWDDFGRVVLPDAAQEANQGTYAVRLRKRRACPYHRMLVEAAIKA